MKPPAEVLRRLARHWLAKAATGLLVRWDGNNAHEVRLMDYHR
jgi:hypothetical protein